MNSFEIKVSSQELESFSAWIIEEFCATLNEFTPYHVLHNVLNQFHQHFKAIELLTYLCLFIQWTLGTFI